jgi:tetratricopeptide (TPR) repeat protein
MKNEASQPQRRNPNVQARRRPPSSAAAILKGKAVARTTEDYFSPSWLLLWFTLLTISLICFLFTPYTHQLDEIKNVILMFCPPFLLIAALFLKDFRTMSWRTHGSTILLGLFFVNMLFSFLINDFKLIGERVIWFWAGCATFTVVFAWFMDTDLKMRRTMLFWTLIGLASTILGLFMFAGQGFTAIIYDFMKSDPFWRDSAWTTLFYTLKSSRGDMYSFVLNQDFYAAFLVMTLPIPLAMFLAEQRMLYRGLALSAFLLMNVCLILTNSNDSYPSIIVGYILFFALYMIFARGWKPTWNGMLTFLTFLVMLIAEIDFLLNVALKILTTSDGSFIRILVDALIFAACMWRMRAWERTHRLVTVLLICFGVLIAEVALLMLPTVASTWAFKSAAFEGRKVLWGGGFWPWLYGYDRTRTHLDWLAIMFGVGPGGYRHFFPWFRRPDFFDQQINNVTTFGHNWYLDVGLEMGVVGLVLFMWFHFRVIKDAIHQIRTTQSRTRMLYQLAIVCGLAGIAIQNFSSPNNRWAVAGMTYWAMFGLSMGLHHLEHPGTPSRANESALPVYMSARIAALLFAFIFLWRCTFSQAFNYWSAAKKNATGLKLMESAQSGQLPEDTSAVYLQTAKTYFEEAIRENPTFATSYYKLGNVYNSLGSTDRAIQTYENLNKLSPSYSEIYLNLGIMYYIEASEFPRTVSRKRKEAEQKLAEAAKARSEERQQLRDEAGQLMEEATTLEQQLGEKTLHNYQKSYEAFQEAARQSLKPNVQMLAGDQGRELAQMYEEAGEHEKAQKILQEIKQYYWSVINYEPKLEDVKQERKKKYPQAEQRLLELARLTKDGAEAEKVLKKLVSENPDNPQYLMQLLRSNDSQDKTAEKLAYLESAAHDNPVDAHLRLILADAYAQAGQNEKYLAELERVEVLQPNNTSALSGLYLAFKENNSPKAQQYRDKLGKLGVSADDLTTVIKEGASTASLAAAKHASQIPAASTDTSAAAEAALTPTPQSAVTSPAASRAPAATSMTAASSAITAPAPVTQPPPPGVKSSDAPTTAPAAESSTSVTK